MVQIPTVLQARDMECNCHVTSGENWKRDTMAVALEWPWAALAGTVLMGTSAQWPDATVGLCQTRKDHSKKVVPFWRSFPEGVPLD